MSSTPPETLNRIGAYRMRAESTFHKSLKELQAYQSAHPLDELILRNEAKWEMKNEPKLVEFKFKRQPYVRPEPKLGRDEPCPCHSGRKFKNCCLRYEANSREQPPLKLQPRPNCTVVELRAAVPDDRQCRWHVGRFGPG